EFGKARHPPPAIEGDSLASEGVPALRQLIAPGILREPAPAILGTKRELLLTVAGHHATSPRSDSRNRLLRLRAVGAYIARANRVCCIDAERRGSCAQRGQSTEVRVGPTKQQERSADWLH